MAKMTWTQFEDKYGDGDGGSVHIFLDDNSMVCFWQDGDIVVTMQSGGISCRIVVAKNRTPEQMEKFLLAIRG